MNSLTGKHALLTGGGTGIGLAAARALAARGALITLAARNLERLQTAATEIGAAAVALDVRQEASVESAFDLARRAHGPVSILVNNAGVAPTAPLHRTELSMWNDTLAVNLTGAFLCARAALVDMYAGGWGRIVNVASIAGLQGDAYISAYCASKHGLVGITRALAKECAKRGVTVNAICPGYVDTDVVVKAGANIASKTKLSEEEARASLYAGNPQGRLITPNEVASAISWLCSDGAAATNGAAIPMSGGEV